MPISWNSVNSFAAENLQSSFNGGAPHEQLFGLTERMCNTVKHKHAQAN